MKLQAAPAYFVWDVTDIEVPYGASLDLYKDKYTVYLYVNGEKSNDFTVEKEVNCSSFSTVLTNRIGDYIVYYKAYSSTYYVSSEHAIVFHVIDITPPIIELKQNVLYVNYGNKITDYSFANYRDDVSVKDKITITIDDSRVNYVYLGTYDAIFIARDEYGNESEMPFKVKIVDNKAPVIRVLSEIRIGYGTDIDIPQFLCAMDEYDGELTNQIQVKNFSKTTLGVQFVQFFVEDSSGNKTVIEQKVTVCDVLSPSICLTTREVTLGIEDYSNYDEDFFRQYIANVSDDMTEVKDMQIQIDSTALLEEVGDYNVVISALDSSQNKSEVMLKVLLRERQGPVLLGKEEITITEGEGIQLENLVSVFDPYDVFAKDRLEIVSSDFVAVSGDYTVLYRCYNSSGLFSLKSVQIHVLPMEEETSEKKEEANPFRQLETFISIYKIELVLGLIVLVFGATVLTELFRKRRKASRD